MKRASRTFGRIMPSAPSPSDTAIPISLWLRRVVSVIVTLVELTDENREAVLALRVAPGQEQFVSSVADSLAEAVQYPQAKPWFRAVYANDQPVGFVMLSWNVE